MKIEDLSFVSEHVSTIDGQRQERLAEVQGRIRTARRRRIGGAVTCTAAIAAAAFVVISAVPGSDEDSVPPVDQPQTSVKSSEDQPQHLSQFGSPGLSAGSYEFRIYADPGVDTPAAVVDVPDGYDAGADWYVVSPDSDQFLGLWTVDTVDRDACRKPRIDSFAPGPTVEDLADALVAQESTQASAPQPVTLGGYRGLYVELTGPPSLDPCDAYPGLWRDPGERGIYGGGQVDLLWILDVEGQRIVVDASYSKPNSSAAEIDKVTTMAESLKLAPTTAK